MTRPTLPIQMHDRIFDAAIKAVAFILIAATVWTWWDLYCRLQLPPCAPDDSPIPGYNETACQVYLTRTRCRHLTGVIAYHLGHYESTKGHYVTYRIGDRLVREYWMSSEFTVLDE